MKGKKESKQKNKKPEQNNWIPAKNSEKNWKQKTIEEKRKKPRKKQGK